MTFVKRIAFRIPTRLVIGVMTFCAGMFAYMLTFNFSISLLAMVQNQPDDNSTVDLPDYGPRYAWSTYEQSLIVGAYFYGSVLFAVPCGMVLQQFGWAKATILWVFVLCIILTALSPLAAGVSFGCMFAVRFLMGAVQSILYPSYTHLMARWAPPAELGMFSIAIMGPNIGTVLTWSVSGVITEQLGWQASFYVASAIAVVFVIAWQFLVYDAPVLHPRIEAAEREFILDSQSEMAAVGAVKGWPPLWGMLTSLPFWALFWLHFGNCWGAYFALTAVPRFLNEVLGFQLGSTGFLSSLPYILRTVFAVLFGYLSKWLETRYPAVSMTVWRKVYSIFSHILPGLLLIALPYFADQPLVCVALMTASYGLNGAVTVVSVCNCNDLAPNYATTTNSIVNGLGNSAGFLSPLVVAYFTRDTSTISEWHSIFMVGAAVYIVPALVFAIFGSGRVQKWNELPGVDSKQVSKLATRPPAVTDKKSDD